MKKKTAYQKAGVDIDLADKFTGLIAKEIASLPAHNVHRSIGGYAGLYKINNRSYIAATTDGVGTKLKLAFQTRRHDSIGIDLVAMSVNDLICVGARPLFFLDYFATSQLNLKTSLQVIQGIVEGCRQSKIALIGGETAEMPGIYKQKEYDLAGFAVGIVDQADLLDGSRVQEGDVLVGIESSGPHSNGYSLIRKLFKPTEKKWIQRIFKPTQIYVEFFLDLQKKLQKKLKGCAHITGSGFLNIPRIHSKYRYEIVIPKSFKRNPVFTEICRRAEMDMKQAYETLNMGIGFVAAVSPDSANQAIQTAKRHKLNAFIIGKMKKAKKSDQSAVYIRDQANVVRLQ